MTGNAAATLTQLDKISGTGTGNVLNLVDLQAGGTALATGISVSGVQTVNVTASGASGADNFSNFTGLTQLNVTEAGGAAGTTAAATTAVTLTDSAAAASTINVQGGSNVAVTANGVTAAGTINVGTTTQAAGTVSVTENMLATQTGLHTADAINVTGGTSVTVTANLNEKAGAGNTVTGGVISVTGGSATTTVTVNQTAAATAANAQLAVAGVSQTVGATPAAPGVQAVTATTQTPAELASAAVAGVVDGQVIVQDANYGTQLANTITSVSLANFGNNSQINDNALTSLSLTGGTGTLTLTNGATTPTNTTLALSLDGVGTSAAGVTFADANGEVKTLNVTTATADSYLTVTDAHLQSLNISGTNTLHLSTVPATVTTIAVSGAAGFNDGGTLAADAALTSFTTTSSGKIVATLDDTKQSFVGSTGQDVITISADATKAITGGSATNNEVIFNKAATTFNATAADLTNTNVTGFSVFGLGANSSGTWDLSKFNSGFNAIDVTAGNTAANVANTIVNAATGTSLSIDGSGTDTGSVSLSYVDTTGATDTTNLTIGSATAAGLSIASVTLADANGVGVNTVNVTTLGTDINNAGGATDTIGALNDNGLSVLNVSGTAGLSITALDETAHQATAFTINSTESGQNGTTIGTLTDINLGNLTFTGTANADVGQLVVAGGSVTNLTITNSGTGMATVGDGTAFTDAALTKLTLNGNVNLTTGVLAATSGVTIAGSTDNAHVTLNLAGATTGTDSISLGNANNSIIDTSIGGTVNVTVGTGFNLIKLGDFGAAGTTTTGTYNVTLGAHTDTASLYDSIFVADTGSASVVATPTTVITGAVKGDVITTTDANALTVTTLTANQLSSLANAANLATAISQASAMTVGAHGVDSFVYGGNTYVVENVAAGTAAATSTVLELAGVHTISSTGNAAGAFHVAS
ncbi:beta strand repeat-containing protein [Paraburkholderia sp. BR10923]|uniref:beta strand repeat-containing protein n=1 Tax=Paraburkholderia sp. BR10923 TaxID=3236992 RepID=UPI0034CE312E